MNDDDLKEYRQRLIDAFEVPELFDYMEVTMDEFLDAFPDKWEDNYELRAEVGCLYGDSEDDVDEDDWEYNPEQEVDDDYA